MVERSFAVVSLSGGGSFHSSQPLQVTQVSTNVDAVAGKREIKG